MTGEMIERPVCILLAIAAVFVTLYAVVVSLCLRNAIRANRPGSPLADDEDEVVHEVVHETVYVGTVKRSTL